MKKAREKLAASQAVIPPVSIPTVPHERYILYFIAISYLKF